MGQSKSKSKLERKEEPKAPPPAPPTPVKIVKMDHSQWDGVMLQDCTHMNRLLRSYTFDGGEIIDEELRKEIRDFKDKWALLDIDDELRIGQIKFYGNVKFFRYVCFGVELAEQYAEGVEDDDFVVYCDNGTKEWRTYFNGAKNSCVFIEEDSMWRTFETREEAERFLCGFPSFPEFMEALHPFVKFSIHSDKIIFNLWHRTLSALSDDPYKEDFDLNMPMSLFGTIFSFLHPIFTLGKYGSLNFLPGGNVRVQEEVFVGRLRDDWPSNLHFATNAQRQRYQQKREQHETDLEDFNKELEKNNGWFKVNARGTFEMERGSIHIAMEPFRYFAYRNGKPLTRDAHFTRFFECKKRTYYIDAILEKGPRFTKLRLQRDPPQRK